MATAVVDPLALLRDFTKNKKQIVLQDNYFIFDNIKIPRNTETSFRASKGKGPGYQLDALWFLLRTADIKYTDYLNECKKHGFPKCSLVDKREIIDYLTGEIDTCASIVPLGPSIPILDTSSTDLKRSISEITPSSSEQPSEKKPRIENEEVEKEREMFRKKLLEPVSKQVNVEAPSTATGVEGLSADKIFQLKLKRQVQKQKAIKVGDEAATDLTTSKSTKFVEADAEATQLIVKRERPIRTRTSVLQATKKHFTDIIDAVNKLKQQESKQKERLAKQQQEQKRKSQTYDRYGEVQEDRFWKERLPGNAPEEFQIDTRGSFTQVDPARLRNPETVAQHVNKQKQRQKEKVKSPGAKPTKSDGALTSLVTTYNVREFLLEGVFVPTLEKKKSGAKKEASVILERKTESGIQRYQVIDNVSKLSPSDWHRVIAVFALGATWQFKGWLWDSPVELFSKVCGFYLHYEDEAIPPTIKSWDVKILTISKTAPKKHLVQTAALQFWKSTDEFVKIRKSA